MKEALKVYEIPKKFVFASRLNEETGEVVIVTNGGKKIVHKGGDPAKFELSYMEVTGTNPPVEMVRNKKLNQRVPKSTR